MITTRRSTNESNEMFYGNEKGNVAVLDREATSSYAEYSRDSIKEEDCQKAKLRMQENLEKILNFDKNQQVVDTQKVDAVDKSANPSEDDIRPSSTTMQFGDADVNTMLNELRTDEKIEAEFKAVNKNKLVVALYSICIAVVLALIIFNTGIIAVLSSQTQASSAKLESAISEYNAVVEDYNQAVSEENIIDIAENVYNMIKK